MGDEFADVLPQLQPLFLNLSAVPAAELETSGSHLGRVLELIQRRGAGAEEFRDLLGRAVGHLEGLPAADRSPARYPCHLVRHLLTHLQ